MHLVLSDPGDAVGRWIEAGLRRRGMAVRRVDPHTLLQVPLRHHVGSAGAWFEAGLPDGRLDSRDTTGYVNRCPPPDRIAAVATEDDRDYAAQEQRAALASLLESLPGPGLNAPRADHLTGPGGHLAEWRSWSRVAGLPPGPGAPSHVVVVGDAVLGPLPGEAECADALRDACRRLAHGAGARLLGIRLHDGDGVRFGGATPTPDLRPHGDEALDALAAALRGRA